MVWVETNGPCTVEVLGCPARTFAVEGHHYALVHCAGLEPGSITPYEVALDGTRVWPPADFPFPPSVVRTHDPASPTSIVFGPCRGRRRAARVTAGIDRRALGRRPSRP
ncbi:MAG TPA: hypothetical protein VES79_00270, partial [Solirubrobacteraceae bacterium]|nr:hypothetical protein [Solirubrobacteraceae bacterium]